MNSSGGNAKLDAFAYTKASDDEGNGTLVGGGHLTINSHVVGTKDWSGLGELVRFRIKNGDASPATTDFILFRTLPPVWFDAVDAS